MPQGGRSGQRRSAVSQQALWSLKAAQVWILRNPTNHATRKTDHLANANVQGKAKVRSPFVSVPSCGVQPLVSRCQHGISLSKPLVGQNVTHIARELFKVRHVAICGHTPKMTKTCYCGDMWQHRTLRFLLQIYTTCPSRNWSSKIIIIINKHQEEKRTRNETK